MQVLEVGEIINTDPIDTMISAQSTFTEALPIRLMFRWNNAMSAATAMTKGIP